ncbi:MAG: hypothetical protein OXU20_07495 [Myxococcales bacterium]|nr:hypothetical protein [Myxococcales bacterium]MDD9966508.1 hypothetical protein [Myxococcales bacterium]
MDGYLESLANHLVLGDLLAELARRHGGWDLVAHWKQGEFHHDVVVRLPSKDGEAHPAVLVVATNCNGGVKEVLAFHEVPDRYALWHHRCPDEPEFRGQSIPILASTRTDHWFDPCVLLAEDARSELKPEFRRRQRGGGWEPRY